MDRRAFLASVAAAAGGCLAGDSLTETTDHPEPPESSPILEADEPIRGILAPSPDRIYAQTETTLTATGVGGERQWTYDADAPIVHPTLADDSVYLATEPAECGFCPGGTAVEAVDDASGDRRWRVNPDVSSFYLLNASSGSVFGGTTDDALGESGEELFALDADNGERQWLVESGDAFDGHYREETLYVPTSGLVYAYDADTGDERWRARYSPGPSDTWLLGDRLVVADHGFHALSLDEGEPDWSFTGEGYDTDDSFIMNSVSIDRTDATILAGDWDGVLWAIAAESGDVRWHAELGEDRVRSVRFDDDRAYAQHGPTTYGISPGTGDLAWDQHLEVPGELAYVRLEPAGETPFALAATNRDSDSRSWLLALDPGTGEERWRRGPLPFEGYTERAGRYLLVALDRRLYAVGDDRPLPTDVA